MSFFGRIWQQIDPFLLLFMVFFTIDKAVFKPVAIFVALLWLAKTVKKADLKEAPLFYIVMPVLGLVNLIFLQRDLSAGPLMSFSIGTIYWLMAFVAFIVVRVRIKDIGLLKTEKTLTAFFILNAVVSVFQLLRVIYISGEINPYNSEAPEYGNSTGDFIQGIFLAPCYINMFVNSAFAVYFLYTRRYKLSLVGAALAFITTSNFANVIFILVLLVLFVILNVKKARIAILSHLGFAFLFYLFVSYGNLSYFAGSFNARSADSTESAKLRAILLKKSKKGRSSLDDKEFGKLISLRQTKDYLERGTGELLFGAGIGAFSSQLALRTSDIPLKNSSRLFAKLPRYVSDDFRENHYRVFSTVYRMGPEYHSIRHLPNSELNHLVGEYGVLGLISFFVFYVGFFLKKIKRASYSILIGIMMGYFLLFDYMFEYLSLVLFFEIFFLTDLKRNEEKSLG